MAHMELNKISLSQRTTALPLSVRFILPGDTRIYDRRMTCPTNYRFSLASHYTTTQDYVAGSR